MLEAAGERARDAFAARTAILDGAGSAGDARERLILILGAEELIALLLLLIWGKELVARPLAQLVAVAQVVELVGVLLHWSVEWLMRRLKLKTGNILY